MAKGLRGLPRQAHSLEVDSSAVVGLGTKVFGSAEGAAGSPDEARILIVAVPQASANAGPMTANFNCATPRIYPWGPVEPGVWCCQAESFA
jgi:hypothetical protein